MIGCVKTALFAILLSLCSSNVFAQTGITASSIQDDQTPPEPAIPQNFGRQFPPGWSLSGSADALALWDSNPALSQNASSDAAQRYVGRIDLSHVAKKGTYLLSYIPEITRYHDFSELNSVSHTVVQQLHSRLSNTNSLDWNVDARRYPAYAGSSLASSNIGVLLMALTGVTGWDLMDNVTSAQNDFRLSHVINNQSSVHFTAGGSLVQYSQGDKTPYASLFTEQSSKTWNGNGGVDYERKLDRGRSLGIGATENYFQFTAANYHLTITNFTVRYSQEFRNGWSYAVNVGPSIRRDPDMRSTKADFNTSFELSRATNRWQVRAYAGRDYRPGLVSGSLTDWTGVFSYQVALTKRWIGGVFANYENSTLAAASSGHNPSSEVYSSAAQLGYRLTRHATWIANYGFTGEHGQMTSEQHIKKQQFLTGVSFQFDSFLRE